MPFVPVAGFWTTAESISRAELLSIAGGREQLVVMAADAEAIGALLGIDPGNWTQVASLEELEAALTRAIGIVRITEVTPRVHALALDGVSLFGVDRVRDLAEWPLLARVSADAGWDQSASWTWVAAGDVMMDRGVALAVREHGGDGDYLFDGGTARVTGTKCCSFFGFDYPTTERTGNAGAVRDLLTSADLATANLESAVLVNAPYHAKGFTFTADASLLDAVDRAGFDFMSMGNNHIRNAGPRGIRTAAEQLDLRGISHSGAGRGDASGEPGYVDVNGLRVAIISCDAIIGGWTAGPEKFGTFNCRHSDVVGRIQEVRPNADVVVVFPHWGHEYHPKPADYQRRMAASWFDAGADLVIGAHSHIAGAVEEIDGHMVFYSMGNLVFDQDFRQSTMMGVVPEMTFNGTTLVQVQLHATLIVDSQPNLCAAEDGGQFVFDQMREASDALPDYSAAE
jgi:poly-gamma-glutamate capsule biosynthesis protein CapA/YwtB (metallophosphatase superfamily)